MDTLKLEALTVGMPILIGGDRYVTVDDELAAAFSPGDSILVVDDPPAVLHLPADDLDMARAAVDRAGEAFAAMGGVGDEAITAFYLAFAELLEDDDVFAPVAAANARDVERARERGRSTTRLVLSDGMRANMVDGLRTWAAMPSQRGLVTDTLEHDGWQAEVVQDGLGIVAFVFEGRPNVFADATGVLRSGNTVVFRIGSDALGTARALVDHALQPALDRAGLPPGAVTLLDAPSHAAAWAMFHDPRLGLAVARGSGAAVAQLGAIARSAGNPVSLHGTGGAWLVATAAADRTRLAQVVATSLDRKVCNTLNTIVVTRDAAADLVPIVLGGLEAAGDHRGHPAKLHVRDTDLDWVPEDWFTREVEVARAEGPVLEPQAEPIDGDRLGDEWEWEDSPEVTLAVADHLDQAIAWCNEQSPRFVASLVSEDEHEHAAFFAGVDAPFVGDGFTRWVDGQYALDKPELGLSNWQSGRLFARSGILSGDSVHTQRLRVRQSDPTIRR